MYLMAGQATTERRVKADSVVVVGVPGTDRLTATHAGQLYSGGQLLYPKLPLLMTLGNSKDVAKELAQNIPSLFPQLQQKQLEERLLEPRTQLEGLRSQVAALNANTASRAQPFLTYLTNQGGATGLYEVQAKILAGKELSRREVDEFTEVVHGALRRDEAMRRKRAVLPTKGQILPTKGQILPTKGQIKDYIREGKADEQTYQRFAGALSQTVSQAFAEQIEYFELEHRISQISDEVRQQIMLQLQQVIGNGTGRNGNSEGLEALVQAVSAIKSGNAPHGGVMIGGTEVKVYELTKQMIEMLVGVEPKEQFLCGIDAVVEKADNGTCLSILAPFIFKAANGTNLPEELRQNHLPTQKAITYTTVLDRALKSILVAYLNAADIIPPKVTVRTGLLMRSMMPENSAILTAYPEDLVTISDNKPLTDRIASRAVNDFENGEMARLAARQLGLTGEELSPEGLERLVSLQNMVLPIFPMGIYKLAAIKYRANDIDEGISQLMANQLIASKLGDMDTAQVNRESHKDIKGMFAYTDLLQKQAHRISETLHSFFGVDVDDLPDYEDMVEETIKLFGEERIGFIRHVFAAAWKAA